MKKLMMVLSAACAFAAFGEIYTIGLSGNKDAITRNGMGLKEAKVYTNVLGSATCAGGVGQADVNKYIFGGDAVIATGINKPGETVKAKLVIENK